MGTTSENKEHIRVYVRIKPQDDAFEYSKTAIKVCNAKNVPVEYSFDRVFGPESKSIDIYRLIRPTVKEENKNISILAYGQTGSGKTHTMNGSLSEKGIIPLILNDLLQQSQVSVSFIEIYNEKIIDLADGEEKTLRESGGTVQIQNQIFKKVSSFDEYCEVSELALKSRKTGATLLNRCSSRSHLIVQVLVGPRIVNLVDLAGSENNKRTGNEGIRMEESSNINRSLFVLHKLVNAIVNKEQRIPYRDSKLTRLLQNSIGGQSISFFIATVINSVECVSEVINTLNFAAKSRKILNSLKESKGPEIKQDLFARLYAGKRGSEKIRELSTSTKKKGCSVAGKNKGDSVESVSTVHTLLEHESPRHTDSSERPVLKQNNSSNVSSSSIRSSFVNKNEIEMTPITKQKSLECFLKKAQSLEDKGDYKSALDVYKTIRKFAESDEVSKRIKELQNALKKQIPKLPRSQALKILNSGIFLDVKKLKGVGDKKAQAIVDFVAGGNFFESLDDLRMIFQRKGLLGDIRWHRIKTNTHKIQTVEKELSVTFVL